MNLKTLMIILTIIAIIIAYYIYTRFRKKKDNAILLFGGAAGTGKSFNLTERSRKFLSISMYIWKKYNKPINPIYKIKYFKKKLENKEEFGLDKPKIYSNYPIVIKFGKHKIISEELTNDIMFLNKSIPLNSIVVIDEFSSWINQFEYNEIFSKTLNDHIQHWRHYHGNYSHLLIADQCTNKIPIQIRYACNNAIVTQSTKHYLKFIHITKYKNIEITDDIKNVEIVDDNKSDTDDKILKFISFGFKRKYDDRSFSNRYTYINDNSNNYKYMNSILKADLTISKPNINDKYINLDNLIKKAKGILKDNESIYYLTLEEIKQRNKANNNRK